jgi:hypothetical protein
MSRAGVSVFVFGAYMLVVGPILLLAPNFLLGLFGYPTTDELWIRVLGLIVALLGYYYVVAARNEYPGIFRASVYARSSVFVCFAAFVLLGKAQPGLVLFGAVDLLGAIWTALALRSFEHRG